MAPSDTNVYFGFTKNPRYCLLCIVSRSWIFIQSLKRLDMFAEVISKNMMQTTQTRPPFPKLRAKVLVDNLSAYLVR